MKETETKHEIKIENVRQAEVKTQVKHIGIMQPHKGQKIWEYNYVTNQIQIAEMEKVPFVVANPNKNKVAIANNPLLGFGLNNRPKSIAKVIERENCTYVKAINIENAVKKLGLVVKIVKNKKK